MTNLPLSTSSDITNWQQAYDQHMVTTQSGIGSTLVTNSNFELLALGRAFYPKPFVTSSVQHVIALPWATEYYVLPYWFFFFSLGLVAIWLVTLYVQTTLHLESRFLRRETRGFSRAQTGDALTSVVPLAWSISMLMHASVHSFNFDDNTAGAVFSFNVLAYQWGWNYYFPADLLRLFREGPKRVGHSAVEYFDVAEPYSSLLARFRYEHVRRLSLQGEFVSRSLPLLSPLTFFAQAASPEVFFEPLLFVPAGVTPAYPPFLGGTSDTLFTEISSVENTNAPLFSAYAWLSSSPLFRLLGGFSGFPQLGGFGGFLTLGLAGGFGENPARPQGLSSGALVFMGGPHLSPAGYLLPTRPLPSLSLVGNRLFLVHRHLSGRSSWSFANPQPATLFSSPLSLGLGWGRFFLETLPGGFLPHAALSDVVSPANLMGLSGDQTGDFLISDFVGWGALGSEDLGLTNGAASGLLVSAGASAARLHSLVPGAVGGLNVASGDLGGAPFMFFLRGDLVADWAQAWLLTSQAGRGPAAAASFFLPPQLSAPLFGAQAYLAPSYLPAVNFGGGRLASLLFSQPSWLDTQRAGASLGHSGSGPAFASPAESHRDPVIPFYFSSPELLLSPDCDGFVLGGLRPLENLSPDWCFYKAALRRLDLMSRELRLSLLPTFAPFSDFLALETELAYLLVAIDAEAFYACLPLLADDYRGLHIIDEGYVMTAYLSPAQLTAADLDFRPYETALVGQWGLNTMFCLDRFLIPQLRAMESGSEPESTESWDYFFTHMDLDALILQEQKYGTLCADFQGFGAPELINLYLSPSFLGAMGHDLDVYQWAHYSLNQIVRASHGRQFGTLRQLPFLLAPQKFDPRQGVGGFLTATRGTLSVVFSQLAAALEYFECPLCVAKAFACSGIKSLTDLLMFINTGNLLFVGVGLANLGMTDLTGLILATQQRDLCGTYAELALLGLSNHLDLFIFLANHQFSAVYSEARRLPAADLLCLLGSLRYPRLVRPSAPMPWLEFVGLAYLPYAQYLLFAGFPGFGSPFTPPACALPAKLDTPGFSSGPCSPYFASGVLYSPLGPASSVFRAASLGSFVPASAVSGGAWLCASLSSLVGVEAEFLAAGHAYSSRLLTGLNLSKPARSFSALAEPLDFTSGSVGPAFSPWLASTNLFDWFSGWVNFASQANAPAYKLWRGGFVGRLSSNELGAFVNALPPLVNSEVFLAPKNPSLSPTPHLTLVNSAGFFIEEAPAILDQEWALPAAVFALELPNPFEDLDPNFVYRRWTTEVNTTRRTDHSARYQVTAGAFFASRFQRDLTVGQPTGGFEVVRGGHSRALVLDWASLTGPQGYRAVSPSVALFQPAGPLFLNHPDSPIAPLQPVLGSSLIHAGLVLGEAGPVTTPRGANLAPVSSLAQGARSLVEGLVLGQAYSLGRVGPLGAACGSFAVGGALPASIWAFRPSVFSQNLVYQFGGGAEKTPLTCALLSLSSLYSHLLASTLLEGDVSLVKAGVWQSGSSHPLLAVINLLPTTPTALGFFDRFLSGVAEQWALGGASQRDLYYAMPTDVRSIRRLRASKAVCLPCDVPMHIVCGSKDVIHSWAIPGLGVKIDCIPGFSSHRRLILRWRGTFWGQCMEVCGRYHHWMPILVHVTHRDLFLSWCLGFLKALEARPLSVLQSGPCAPQVSGWLAAREVQA